MFSAGGIKVINSKCCRPKRRKCGMVVVLAAPDTIRCTFLELQTYTNYILPSL
jgi:hypothetical protein